MARRNTEASPEALGTERYRHISSKSPENNIVTINAARGFRSGPDTLKSVSVAMLLALSTIGVLNYQRIGDYISKNASNDSSCQPGNPDPLKEAEEIASIPLDRLTPHPHGITPPPRLTPEEMHQVVQDMKEWRKVMEEKNPAGEKFDPMN